jgi:hypothetical protein
MSTGEAADLSPEDIVAMFPPIAQSLAEAARRAGTSPTEMQSNFWNRAVHSSKHPS